MDLDELLGHPSFEFRMRNFTPTLLRQRSGVAARPTSGLCAQSLPLREQGHAHRANAYSDQHARNAPQRRSNSAHLNEVRLAPLGKGKWRQDGPCFAWPCQARRGGFSHG